jgi:signal transduction histidine kinase/CheY-like chemotaxis protein
MKAGAMLPLRRVNLARRDGTVIPVEMEAFVVDFDGAASVLVIARDVTERLQLQARMLQADRLVSVGTLAAGVAHEINNPLAYILLNLGQMNRQLGDLVARERSSALDELVRLVEQSREGAERVRDIVRDLKTFSRPDEERRSFIDVRALLDSTIHMASNEIRHRARLVRQYEDVPFVNANESRLAQVFLNLLVNAAQAIPEGDANSNEIRVATRADDCGRVVVEVSDTGEGIPPEVLTRIFDPFFTTKPVGLGTGLGLSVCLGIIHSLGGSISVDSHRGHGSTFRVALPVVSEEVQGPPVDPPPMRLAPLRILIVDDDPGIASAIVEMLREHEIVTAASGREALEHLRSGAFDAVFCDLMMPDVTGMELFEHVRRDQREHADRFIFMTGGAFTPRAREFLESVANPCVDKPFDVARVRALLSALTTREV